jgi:2-oxoglutarate dehydrogenase complex dehydrogenase (E1) component-like enzyme
MALVRVEQLHPFPRQELTQVLAAYPQATQIYWVQEEPSNMGAWNFMQNHLRPLLRDDQALTYVGRRAAASPASGSFKIHQREEADLINRAFAR